MISNDHRTTRRALLATTGMGAASIPLLALSAAGQDATPAGGSARDEAEAEAAYVIQFQHPEKVYFYLPGFQDEAFLATMYGVDVDTYLAIRADFDAAAHGAAEELLADEAFASLVDALPFEPGSAVVAIGESDTDDLQSWFEILRHLVTMRRPDDGIRFVNHGISGQNTSQALGQMGVALAEQPTWLFCLLGGNDVLRNGFDADKTEVSIDETERNLTEMRRLATEGSDLTWVWLTRPPIDEARVATWPGFEMGGITFRNADVELVNDFIARQPETVVDIYSTFGDPSTDLLGPDGVHASLAGQAAIARTVVETLAG